MQRIENFKLLDPQKAKNRIEKNKLKFFLGGYSGYLTCKVTWQDGTTEEGLCGFSTQEQCCDANSRKYPVDCFGPMTECECE